MAFPGGPRPVLAPTLLLAGLVGLAACGDDDEKDTGPCAGVSGTCVAFSASDGEAAIRDRMATATAGTTFAFGPGTFAFELPLEVTVANVTIKGAGRAETVLDFSDQAGAEGVLGSADGFTLRDLTVQDTLGNGVKVVGADDVLLKNVRVHWTNADETTHGAYGLYPVESTHVLIEGCLVSGASDAGIYVGQSDQIVVRDNEATLNVAGLEIENSFNADVHDNTLHGNTGGVLVFDLPGLPQKGGHAVRVFDNVVTENNHENFGAPGGTVALVPAGTGVVVMANSDVEVFGNTVTGNQSAAIAVISYLLTGGEMDEGYDPFPRDVFVHDNTVTGNGVTPDTDVALGELLAGVQAAALEGGPIPDVVWDGIADPAGEGANPQALCVEAGASWLNLGMGGGSPAPSVDDTGFRCSHPALPAVAPW